MMPTMRHRTKYLLGLLIGVLVILLSGGLLWAAVTLEGSDALYGAGCVLLVLGITLTGTLLIRRTEPTNSVDRERPEPVPTTFSGGFDGGGDC